MLQSLVIRFVIIDRRTAFLHSPRKRLADTQPEKIPVAFDDIFCPQVQTFSSPPFPSASASAACSVESRVETNERRAVHSSLPYLRRYFNDVRIILGIYDTPPSITFSVLLSTFELHHPVPNADVICVLPPCSLAPLHAPDKFRTHAYQTDRRHVPQGGPSESPALLLLTHATSLAV